MRRFELTISVWYPDNTPLPESYNDWIEYAFGTKDPVMGASQLERVVETKHPPAKDVVFKRREGRNNISNVWQ